jgi:hypothetical protein
VVGVLRVPRLAHRRLARKRPRLRAGAAEGTRARDDELGVAARRACRALRA